MLNEYHIKMMSYEENREPTEDYWGYEPYPIEGIKNSFIRKPPLKHKDSRNYLIAFKDNSEKMSVVPIPNEVEASHIQRTKKLYKTLC